MDSADLDDGAHQTPSISAGSISSASTKDGEKLVKDAKMSLTSIKKVIIVSILFYSGCVCFGAACSALTSQASGWSQTNNHNNDNNILQTGCADGLAGPSEQFFALDLTFGHNMTFTRVKLLDAAWDTTIGQGGRLLHGWILYQTIIRRLLLFAMEHSTVTYDYFITVSFTRSSFETLWVLLTSFRGARSISVILCSVLLVYALLYTLLFTLIWSAATGYLSLSHRIYAMPDGNMIPMNSEDLAICWSLDPTRLGLSNGTEVVEVGMNLSTIGSATTPSYDFSSHAVLQEGCGGPCGLIYTSGGWKTNVSSESIWDYFGILSGSQSIAEQSENFKAIRAYALTAQLLQMTLQPSTWVLLRYYWYNEPDDWTDATNAQGSVKYVDGWSRTFNETVTILGYETPEQRQGPEQTHNDSLTVFPFPYNETGLEKVSWVNLTLNSSTPTEWKDLRSTNLHYNSTLKYKNSSFHLSSPFLDVGYGCSGNTKFSTLGNCICYKHKPISLDLLSDDKAVCKTTPGYVWGFSSRLTVLGMALEATWMGCCFILYVYLSIRCKCIRNDAIKTAGTLKLAMELAESAQSNIGGYVTFMTEEKVKEELKDIRIGYKPETLASDQNARYRLVSSPPDKTAKKRFAEGLGTIRNWGLKHDLYVKGDR